MKQEKWITFRVLKKEYLVDDKFLDSLIEYKLVTTELMDNEPCLSIDDIARLESIIRMYYDMDINPPGIEAIQYLLERMNTIITENRVLKQQLSVYE